MRLLLVEDDTMRIRAWPADQHRARPQLDAPECLRGRRVTMRIAAVKASHASGA
jgi:hypothetical protein